MSSVSAACIFYAYSASSAHTDTFYIVPQIIRVRNSKRHFFSKLTFPHIIQPLRFTLRSHRPQPPCLRPTATSTTAAPPHPTATSTTTAPLHPKVTSTTAALPSPYGHIDHNRSASSYGHIDHNRLAFALRQHRPQPPRFTLRQHRPQPLCFTQRQHRPQPPHLRPTATSTTAALPSP